MKFENYPEYITSGFDWICEFPKEWTIRKVKSLCSQIGSGTTPDTSNDSFYENGTINFLQTGDLTDGYIVNTVKKINDKALNEVSALKIYPSNSLVIAMYGATIGKLGILNIDTTTNQACCVLNVSQELDSKFAFYSFLSARNYLISLSQGGSQPNIKQETIKSLRIPTPKVSEQKNIVSFLDVETAKIDNLISKQEQLIKLLEEQRKSIISHAVTKGLNPDAPMKDSGVEWLGAVPEHWDIKPIKSLYSRVKRTGFENETLLSVYREYGVIVKSSRDDNHNKESDDLSPYQLVNVGDLVINKMKAWQGSLAVSEHRGIVSPAYYIYEPFESDELNNKFIHNQIRSQYFIQSYKNYSKGIRVGQWDLESDLFVRINLYIPPADEQNEIVDYIQSETNKINNLIDKQKLLIEKLQEYRSSIISHVVTGKIDVREAL